MAAREDGRAQRAVRGRAQVSEALLALVIAHGRMPTVDEVATRAGVGRRSVFRYFDGVDALEVETARAMRALVSERVPLPSSSGALDARLTALVQHRAQLYEHITPVRRFLDAARQRGNNAFDSFVDDGRRLLGAHLATMLAPELAAQPALLPVLELVTSWEAWVALRDGQKRSPASSTRVMLLALQRLLAPVALTPSSATAPQKTRVVTPGGLPHRRARGPGRSRR